MRVKNTGPFDRVLHTVGVDGTGLTRIGETTIPPSWSPDGEDLAFAATEGEEAVLYAVRPDGTGLREVWRSEASDMPSLPIAQVSWSPDGSEILFVTDRVYVVGADGSGIRPLSPDLPGGMGAIPGRLVAGMDRGLPSTMRAVRTLLPATTQVS